MREIKTASRQKVIDAFHRKLGDMIAHGRAEQQLTQKALAEKVGISRGNLAMLEGGRYGTNLFTFVKLVKLLHINVGNL